METPDPVEPIDTGPNSFLPDFARTHGVVPEFPPGATWEEVHALMLQALLNHAENARTLRAKVARLEAERAALRGAPADPTAALKPPHVRPAIPHGTRRPDHLFPKE
jgi:hypothetical protein